MRREAWRRAETPGIVRAGLIEKPVVAAKLLKRAVSPIIVVGHEADGRGESTVLDSVTRIARAIDAPVIATGGVSAELRAKGIVFPLAMSVMEAGFLLQDPEWRPKSGRKPPDFAFLLGIPFTIASVIEAGLASLACDHLKIVSLDRVYHPHCDLSFPYQSQEEWEKALEAIAREVEKR
jgi:CO dehydrogenase/acetyl-CoA synthase complex epsilon subunit